MAVAVVSASQFPDSLSKLLEEIDNSPKLTIVAINGPGFGGGNGLVFVCDIGINVKYAKFTLSEVRLGLCPAPIQFKHVIRELDVPSTRVVMFIAQLVGD